MRASIYVLLVVIFAFGCAQKDETSKSAPSQDEDAVATDAENGDTPPAEPVDPLITIIRTVDGESTTSEMLLSEVHLSEFPPPYYGNPHDLWDENVVLELIFEGDQRTQILSYNTLAMTADYVDFYMAELSGAKEDSGDSSYIVSGKNEFGDDVTMEYILPADPAANPLIRITVVE